MVKKMFWKSLPAIILLASVVLPASASVEFVLIGDPGNAEDAEPMYGYNKRPFGAVDYAFRMGKYEITCTQYAEFLNATAADNTYGQCDQYMLNCQEIIRYGTVGNFTYSVLPENENHPITHVSWANAARYCNWLTTGDSENGVYIFESDGSFNVDDPKGSINEELKRGSEPAYWIPNSDEYYKAAYYDPATQTYFDFPTSSNDMPTAGDFSSANSGNWCNGVCLGATDVGAFANTFSPYGCFDMLGNVWEWNEDFQSGILWPDTPVYGPMYHGGGFWSDTPLYCCAEYYSGYTANSITDHKTVDMGMRIASNVTDIPIFIPGDANGDGMVDVGDLGILAGHYGTTEGATWAMGDFNGDGAVDVGDLGILAGHYGSSAEAAAVPEPLTLSLLGFGLALIRKNRK